MFSLYAAVTSCKYSEECKNSMHQFVSKLILGLCIKTAVQNFQRKLLKSILSLYTPVILHKKSEKEVQFSVHFSP